MGALSGLSPVAIISLGILLFEHCTTVTLTRYTQQRTDAPRAAPAVVVLLTETLKLLLAMWLEVTHMFGLGSSSSFSELVGTIWSTPRDTLRLSLPAFMCAAASSTFGSPAKHLIGMLVLCGRRYTVQNILIFVALAQLEVRRSSLHSAIAQTPFTRECPQKNPLSTVGLHRGQATGRERQAPKRTAAWCTQVVSFQVIYQTKLLLTALLSIVFLGRSLTRCQWLCLITLTVGVVAVELSDGNSKVTQESATRTAATVTVAGATEQATGPMRTIMTTAAATAAMRAPPGRRLPGISPTDFGALSRRGAAARGVDGPGGGLSDSSSIRSERSGRSDDGGGGAGGAHSGAGGATARGRRLSAQRVDMTHGGAPMTRAHARSRDRGEGAPPAYFAHGRNRREGAPSASFADVAPGSAHPTHAAHGGHLRSAGRHSAESVGSARTGESGLPKPGFLSPTTSTPKQPIAGAFAALLAAALSSAAGVYFERLVKGREASAPSLWLRNVQLCLFSIPLAMVAVASQGRATMDNGFFRGIDVPTCILIALNASGGLLVAAVIKYGDNILKNFITSCSVILGTCISVYLFDFQLTSRVCAGPATRAMCGDIGMGACAWGRAPGRASGCTRVRAHCKATLLCDVAWAASASTRSEGLISAVSLPCVCSQFAWGALLVVLSAYGYATAPTGPATLQAADLEDLEPADDPEVLTARENHAAHCSDVCMQRAQRRPAAAERPAVAWQPTPPHPRLCASHLMDRINTSR